MGKDQELLDASRSGNTDAIDKLLSKGSSLSFAAPSALVVAPDMIFSI